jgi:uncharacterized protein DUF6454
MRRCLPIDLIVVIAGVSLAAVQPNSRSAVAERVTQLTRDTAWKPVSTLPVKFMTHHPQGMVKIGNDVFVSSVDKIRGVGHLFKIGPDGNRLADIRLGEDEIYHPGGIDYDGENIWVPVGEYRPDSRSIIYRVNPVTMKATEVFRFADHIGAIVRNTDDNTLHGVSWGSRRFYRWTLGPDGRVTNAGTPLQTLNTSHYLDYQDCKYAGARRMLCTGVTEMRQAPGAPPFRLGGIELVDLADGRPLHQVPLLLWTPGGLDMTHNPVWIEATATGLRGYFMPEDDTSAIYIYEVTVGSESTPR